MILCRGNLNISRLLIFFFLALIKIYQFVISPILGPACRFYPSCSEYACQAIARHGPARGLFYAVKRLLRCHPFHHGGVDPVP